MMLAAVILLALLLLAACLIVGGLKLQLDKSVKLLADSTALNRKLATESIRQAISNKL